MKSLVIRVDGNPTLGAGHVVRCVALAQQAQKIGCEVCFVVSDRLSARLLQMHGYDATIVDGDAACLTAKDGLCLAAVSVTRSAGCVLVDSYAVNTSFFNALKSGLAGHSVIIAYIDDRYSLSDGILGPDVVWPVDILVSYLFNAEQVYGGKSCQFDARCLLGSSFAPVRSQFQGVAYDVRKKVQNILITCGSTNQCKVLERIVDAVQPLSKGMDINLVVGCQADFIGKLPKNFHVLKSVKNMAALTRSADIAISAAGTTLYELCAIGIPTVAIPIVENQIPNVKAFVAVKAGRGLIGLDWTADCVSGQLEMLLLSEEKRKAYSSKMRQLVDGNGAARLLGAFSSISKTLAKDAFQFQKIGRSKKLQS